MIVLTQKFWETIDVSEIREVRIGELSIARSSFSCTSLHCFTLLCTALHYFSLLFTSLRYLTLLFTSLHCFALLNTSLHCFALFCTTLHFFAMLCIALYCFALGLSLQRWCRRQNGQQYYTSVPKKVKLSFLRKSPRKMRTHSVR